MEDKGKVQETGRVRWNERRVLCLPTLGGVIRGDGTDTNPNRLTLGSVLWFSSLLSLWVDQPREGRRNGDDRPWEVSLEEDSVGDDVFIAERTHEHYLDTTS